MTDATQHAIIAVSEKVMASVAKDPRVLERVFRVEQKK
jgi:hypothetical protein